MTNQNYNSIQFGARYRLHLAHQRKMGREPQGQRLIYTGKVCNSAATSADFGIRPILTSAGVCSIKPRGPDLMIKEIMNRIINNNLIMINRRGDGLVKTQVQRK